jgi:RimJ/RimL family protein N-acetyltransferase
VRFTGDTVFGHLSEAEAVVAALQRQWAERRMGRFMVVERATGERVGWCGLEWHDDTGEADLGDRFLQDRWGRGYATEASRACIAYAWGPLGLDRLVARAMPENGASVRVLEKLGFRFTGAEVDGGLPVRAFELRRAG